MGMNDRFNPKIDLEADDDGNILTVTNASATEFLTAGTGTNSAAKTGGGEAAKVLKVKVNGTVYYLPLFSSNAS